jgi:hypothetical protein
MLWLGLSLANRVNESYCTSIRGGVRPTTCIIYFLFLLFLFLAICSEVIIDINMQVNRKCLKLSMSATENGDI